LARFSSRNFFSAGTNLSLMLGDCGGLPEPPCRLDAYVQRDEAIPVRTIGGRTLRGSVRLFHRSMVDPYTAQVLNAAVTTRSMWDEHLERQGLRPVFTLNTLNYDSAADLLIPRAVGYSAGVLDRFFRASVGAGVNQDQRVSFQNGSPDEIAEGFFFLLHENPDGVREPLATVALALPPLGETEFMEVRKLPPDPPPGTRCWVVFQGTLGEEPNVVAGRQTSCPVEPPPPVQGSQWAIYQCRFIGLIIGVPGGAPPVYYTYATQSPFTYPEGDPVVQFHEEGGNGFTDCWLSGHAFVPEGGWPPEVRLEHPI
jgi:hypothetical protein